jgi:hypothetical protein
MTAPQHSWQFVRTGGFDQVALTCPADLLHLDQLDQKLWVALSCPTRGLEFPSRTLALLDRDGDGHLRAPELIAAIQWAAGLLRDPELLIAAPAELPLAAIDTEQEEGRAIAAAARHILAGLGRGEAEAINAADTEHSVEVFNALPANGDGIVTASSAGEPMLAQTIATIVTTLGGSVDRSGETGVDEEQVAAFFAAARARLAWLAQAAADPALQPLGAASGDAYAAVQVVRAKIEDYFTRCRLAQFDPRAGGLLNGAEDDFRALAGSQLASDSAAVAALPLAYVEAGRALPLAAGLNPAWQAAITTLRAQVLTPLYGERDELDAATWQQLLDRFAAYATWLAGEPASPLRELTAADLQTLVDGDSEARLLALIAADLALTAEAEAIVSVDRLVHYVRDLARLANNFVSFRDFYSRQTPASFQAGTLYLDGRSCELCVPVLDPGRHATLASLAGVYLAYCDCVRGDEKMSIAAAITAGDSDQLMAGRNGIFYDRAGRDWDATITRIVDHPISIRQAFWSPYKKLARLLAEQLHKLAATKAKGVDELTASTVNAAGRQVDTPPKAPPTPFDAGKFAGIFAAIGLALGALATAIASVVSGFLGLAWWQMPLALFGLMLLVSGPAMAMAFFKLRRRNLGPILDANGWAVNSRARINIPFGRALTRVAALPDNARRSLGDPYADATTPWKLFVFLGIVLMLALLYLRSHLGQ